MTEKPHRKLQVWIRSIDLIETVYRSTEQFPATERYGLTSQMRRAAVSIASNLAEGAARFGQKEKLHFYHISRGSLSELDTQIEIAKRLRFISFETEQRLTILISHVSSMLQGLIASKQSSTP